MTIEQYLQLFGGTGNFRPTASLNISSSAQYSASYFFVTSSFNFSASRISPILSDDSQSAVYYNNNIGSNSVSNNTLFLESSSYNGVFTSIEDITNLSSQSNATQQSLLGDPNTILQGTIRPPVFEVIPTGSYSIGPVSGSSVGSTYYLDAPNNPIGLLQYGVNNIEEGNSNITGSL